MNFNQQNFSPVDPNFFYQQQFQQTQQQPQAQAQQQPSPQMIQQQQLNYLRAQQQQMNFGALAKRIAYAHEFCFTLDEQTSSSATTICW
ncbi:hypothetical protein CU098_005549 [Rhizopus stolonifer]|uniref:Uncharacterized protein n=1 Tax=Rhizopus stolonifer TaxID=4846 RepID=A0A367ITY2_RHIST|nr:hypothetical protein CU098_005549 [Rhizopus stolonifer]